MSDSIKRPVKVYVAAGVITLAAVALIQFHLVVVVALIGLIIGTLLEPVIGMLQRRLHLKHGLAVAATAVLVLLFIGAMIYGGYWLIADQVQKLTEQGPEIWEKLVRIADDLQRRMPWAGMVGGGDFKLGEHLQKITAGALKVLSVGAESLAYIFLVVMLSIFIAGNLRPYGRGLLTLFPVEKRARVAELAEGSVDIVRQWFIGNVIVVSISAAMTAVALLAIGMDYWLLVAALTIILDFIPFLGAVITGLIAVLLTLGTEPDKVVWVLLAYLVIQQVESEVVLPAVMRGRVKLPEAHLLLFVVFMGTALGIVGVFLAPPVFAVLHRLYCNAYVPWVEKRPPPTS